MISFLIKHKKSILIITLAFFLENLVKGISQKKSPLLRKFINGFLQVREELPGVRPVHLRVVELE